MTTSNNALSFRLQAGPLTDLKPITVSIVEGDASSVAADAYIKLDCQRERNQNDFGDAEIFSEKLYSFVAVTREGVNRYSGIHALSRRDLAARVRRMPSMDRLTPIFGGDIAFKRALAVAEKNGARSVVVDCEDSFVVGYDPNDMYPPPSSEFPIHQMLSTMVWGVLKFADDVNSGQINNSVDNIVLAMSERSLAVWKRGCDLYLKCFDELKPEVRSLNDRLTVLKPSIRKLDAFVASATAMISSASELGEINAGLGNIEATMNEHLNLARTERARLMEELQQVERELGA